MAHHESKPLTTRRAAHRSWRAWAAALGVGLLAAGAPAMAQQAPAGTVWLDGASVHRVDDRDWRRWENQREARKQRQRAEREAARRRAQGDYSYSDRSRRGTGEWRSGRDRGYYPGYWGYERAQEGKPTPSSGLAPGSFGF